VATDPVKAAAQRYRINPALFRALVQQESGGNQNARSKAGAIGETQLMPATARGLGVDPYNQQQNLDGGAKYLRQQLDRFGGDVRKALAAYNAGPGAVQKYNGVPPYAETQHYVATILANAGRAGAAPSTPSAPNVPGAPGTTTTVTPGVDNSLLRRQLVSQFLQAGGVKSSNASIAFASGLQGAQDTPATRTTQTTPAARAPARAAAQPQGVLRPGATLRTPRRDLTPDPWEAECPTNPYHSPTGTRGAPLSAEPSPPVTGDELIRHRLVQLEEWRVQSAATVRSVERDVDALKIESATIKGLLIELRTEGRENDKHARDSLARLHERLDSITTAESYEDGRKDGATSERARTWKVVGVTLTLAVAGGGLIVAVLTLILN
jgi:hypothetical protein